LSTQFNPATRVIHILHAHCCILCLVFTLRLYKNTISIGLLRLILVHKWFKISFTSLWPTIWLFFLTCLHTCIINTVSTQCSNPRLVCKIINNWWAGHPSGSIARTRKRQSRFYWSCLTSILFRLSEHL